MAEPVRHRQTKGAATDMFETYRHRATSRLYAEATLGVQATKVRSPQVQGDEGPAQVVRLGHRWHSID
jgi:hypothetical protein